MQTNAVRLLGLDPRTLDPDARPIGGILAQQNAQLRAWNVDVSKRSMVFLNGEMIEGEGNAGCNVSVEKKTLFVE